MKFYWREGERERDDERNKEESNFYCIRVKLSGKAGREMGNVVKFYTFFALRDRV